MSETRITQAQKAYDRINELTAEGLSNSDAIKKVAEETGKKEGTVRAAQYQHRRKLSGGGSRASKSVSPADAVSGARALLLKALDGIDADVEKAKAELKSAQARYDSAVASVSDQKAELQRKIDALS